MSSAFVAVGWRLIQKGHSSARPASIDWILLLLGWAAFQGLYGLMIFFDFLEEVDTTIAMGLFWRQPIFAPLVICALNVGASIAATIWLVFRRPKSPALGARATSND
jgi:hypothetical protein